jgi:hypothetical protein
LSAAKPIIGHAAGEEKMMGFAALNPSYLLQKSEGAS